jgi:putative ABC transport system permease protein
MFKSYLKIAWRNFERNKLFSLINLIGLSVGIAAVLLIGIYIQNELSYDNFHKNKETLFRVGYEFFNKGKSLGNGPDFTPPFGPEAKNEFSEIQSFCRISPHHEFYIAKGENKIKLPNICFADSTFFSMFSFKLQTGNASTVLTQPYSIVLTRGLAEKLFGKEDAVGKTVRFDGKDDYLVTGIAASAPDNSQINYDALISFGTLYKDTLKYFMGWDGGEQYITYLKLHNPSQAESLNKKFPAFLWNRINSQYDKRGMKIVAMLQPIQQVHMKYDGDSDNTRTNLYVFGVVAVLILIISCVNYINLTTVQSSSRFKEIGIRKYLGALRKQLIFQFLGESVFITSFAFILSLLIVYAVTPVYNQILGKPLMLTSGSFLFLISLALVMILIIGVGAGSYLAFYLSALNVQKTLKAAATEKSKHSGFRKGLIVAQFAITTVLMTCTLIVNLQIHYTKNKSVGFDKDHIIAITLTGDNAKDASSVLKQQISQIADVESVSAVSTIPHDGIPNNGFVPEGDTKAMIIHQLDGDEDLMKTFHFKILEGDYFSKDKPGDADGYIINETLQKMLGWEKPIGKTISRNGNHKVIGVVRDFIFSSLHEKIGPLIITNHPWRNKFDYLAIRYKSDNPAPLLNKIKGIWKNAFADAPYDYWFLDEAYNNLYKNEERFQRIFFYFSLLSILLSLAGIFGLVTLTIQQKTKEIGIRKVLGARVKDIVKLTAKSYLLLIITASVIAIPFSYYFMNKWLQDFAYRIQLSWWMFGVAGFVTLIIALITVFIQTSQAARANPVNSLRTE